MIDVISLILIAVLSCVSAYNLYKIITENPKPVKLKNNSNIEVDLLNKIADLQLKNMDLLERIERLEHGRWEDR